MTITVKQFLAVKIAAFLKVPSWEFTEARDIAAIQRCKNAFDDKISPEYKEKIKEYVEVQKEHLKPYQDALVRFKRGENNMEVTPISKSEDGRNLPTKKPLPTKEEVAAKQQEFNDAFVEVIKPYKDAFHEYEKTQKDLDIEVQIDEKDLSIARHFFERKVKTKNEETGEEKEIMNGAKFWPDMETFLEVAKIFKSL